MYLNKDFFKQLKKMMDFSFSPGNSPNDNDSGIDHEKLQTLHLAIFIFTQLWFLIFSLYFWNKYK